MRGAFPAHERLVGVSRSTSKADNEGPGRPTSPGIGDELRDTLRGPVAPVVVPTDLKRTIPMGSGVSAEWVARHASTRSGVHSVAPMPQPSQVPQSPKAPPEPQTPRTKSDRVPVSRTKQPTLSTFPAGTPKLPNDEKRWIGSAVPPGSNPGINLGATMRTHSAPPPAGTPSTTRSSYPPPIVPARTITISPEIAIPPRATVQASGDGRSSSTPPPLASKPPEQREPPAVAVAVETVIPSAAAAETTTAAPAPTQAAPAVSSSARSVTAGSSLPAGGVTTRTLVIGGVLASLAIGTILLLTKPRATVAAKSAVAASATHVTTAADRAPQSGPPARPSTEIVSIPPGAEIVLRGAMVANAPARLVRPSYESLYLLRLPGYQPQLVALSPHSPDQIRVTLQPAGQTEASATLENVTATPGASAGP